ncbi:GDSL-type esterase/lipase family protein [Nocardia sp. NPDC004568]|uniref:SGNH/GDSL hydrolase family protein n=1 Tax=Nocardia sp. NPDC004568 TaxID=3154551 RepID=UPI0033BB0007
MNSSPAVTGERSPAGAASRFLQYTHLDKMYGYLPGMHAAQPAIFGLDPAEYQALREGFAAAARAGAQQLLTDTEAAARVDRWSAAGPSTVLVAGDSLTDDLQSWVEILRAALDLRSSGHTVQLVNHGLSAHTTAMIARSWPATLTVTKPDVVVCALGGNDVTRVGPDPRKTQVSPAESLANLAELRRIAQTLVSPHWIWVTPAPVDEVRAGAFPAFRFGQSSWANSDVQQLSEGIHALGGPVVDLTTVLGVPAAPELVGEDGVHPTLAGQIEIARAVLGPLAQDPGR